MHRLAAVLMILLSVALSSGCLGKWRAPPVQTRSDGGGEAEAPQTSGAGGPHLQAEKDRGLRPTGLDTRAREIERRLGID